MGSERFDEAGARAAGAGILGGGVMLTAKQMLGVLGTLLLLWLALLGWRINAEGAAHSRGTADVAIVLGAAVYGDRPSPVFEERIRHGIGLYKAKAVEKLLFTGGFGEGAGAAESLVARRYALARGIPAEAILTETLSRTTKQNLVEARRLMRAEGLESALIVSDPLHMKRAMRMAGGSRNRGGAVADSDQPLPKLALEGGLPAARSLFLQCVPADGAVSRSGEALCPCPKGGAA
jgi:hypothetical protein